MPLIISWKGVTTGGVPDAEHLVSNGLDLFRTVCDYAGVDVPPGLPGLSLRPLAEGRPMSAWRTELVAETLFDGGRGYDTVGRMMRAGRHKYVCYDRGKHREQLFDLEADPGEMANLAPEARHRRALEQMRLQLARHIEQTGDVFRQVPAHHDRHAWGRQAGR